MDKGKYLDSWKEIAAYLDRNIRTCRSWEHGLGLPVHRLDGSAKPRVFAYTAELDRWREQKGQLPDNEENGDTDGEAANQPDSIPIRRSVRAWVVTALVAGTVLAVIATVLITRHFRPTPASPISRLTLKVEPDHWLDGARSPWEMERPTRTALAISSDGTFVVYSAIEENPGPQAKPRLFLRRINELEAKRIAGTEGGINPFLAPDGKWVGFWADGKLKKVPIAGGVVANLCDASWIFGANWGREGGILFADGESAGLSRVSADGGKPETLTKPDLKREEYGHRLPSWLPGGKSVLFTIMKHGIDPRPSVALLRLDTGKWHVLLQDAADARYVPSGHLVFLSQGTLMAVRFDLPKMEVIGRPVPLVKDVMQAFSVGSGGHTCAGQFGISDTGSLIYAAGGIVPDPKDSLVWVDRKGIEQPVTALQFSFGAPRLSPDDRRIAYMAVGREWQIFVFDLNRGTNSRLTHDGFATFPLWSPDGKWLLFSWMKSAVPNLFRQPDDGSLPMECVLTGIYADPGSWSADGKTVAFVETHPDTRFDIALLDTRSGQMSVFLNSLADEAYPEFSPDGRWIAYASDESGRSEVYVRAFPGPGRRYQISSDGGTQPLWARKGGQIYYRRRSSSLQASVWDLDQMWAVDVRVDGDLSPSKPRLLFEKPGYAPGAPIRTYDLSLDGQRFLMVREERRTPAPVTEMILIQNWFEELERRVPAGKR